RYRLVAHHMALETVPGVLCVLVLGDRRPDPGPVWHAENGDRVTGMTPLLQARNFLTANVPRTRNATSATSWATKKGGSDWVGDSVLNAGTFWNDWAISTKKLK